MQIIQHTELSSAQSSITFSSIPQTFTDLMLVFSVRTARSALLDDLLVQFNGSTANFSNRTLRGNSATGVSSFSYGGGRYLGATTSANATSSTFSSHVLTIPNYTSSSAKSFSVDAVTENNATESLQEIMAGLWNDSNPISSIVISSATSSNLVQYSSATLYGILKGSSGGVTVS